MMKRFINVRFCICLKLGFTISKDPYPEPDSHQSEKYDPDPYKNDLDPQHPFKHLLIIAGLYLKNIHKS
jgi:hypothetical protein